MSSNGDMDTSGSVSEENLQQPTEASLGKDPQKPQSNAGRHAVWDDHITRTTVEGSKVHRQCQCNYCGHNWRSRNLADVSEHLLQCKKLKLQPLPWADVQMVDKTEKEKKETGTGTGTGKRSTV